MIEMPGMERETRLPEPNGWLQWKGTQACMDIRCLCGHLGHIDAEFIYYIRCKSCKRVYYVNGNVQLIELTAAEAIRMDEEGSIKDADL